MLTELRKDREEQSRKWEEQNRKWNEAKAESDQKWEEQNRKWNEAKAESDRKWEEQNRKWNEAKAESDRKWEEQNRKWDDNQKVINDMLASYKRQQVKHESSLDALGARCGLYSEESFRNGLKAILEQSFGVKVLNVTEYDHAGEVFGRSDQIELDIIIFNGMLILCEIKSSISKPEMHVFERKAAYYQKHHNRQVNRKIVISPMVDPRAMPLAKELGIEVYSHSYDVNMQSSAADTGSPHVS